MKLSKKQKRIAINLAQRDVMNNKSSRRNNFKKRLNNSSENQRSKSFMKYYLKVINSKQLFNK